MDAESTTPATYGTTQDIECVDVTKAIDILDATGVPFGLSTTSCYLPWDGSFS